MRRPLLAKRPPSCLLRTLFCPTHSTPHLSYILLRIWQPIQGLVITCGFSGYPEKLRGCLCDESSSGEVWFSWWKHRIFGGNPLWRLSVLLVFMTVLPDFELHCSPLTQLSVSLGISPAYSPCICSPTPIMTYRALPSHPPQKLLSPTVVPFFFFSILHSHILGLLPNSYCVLFWFFNTATWQNFNFDSTHILLLWFYAL